jgi:hypothetical protein
LEHHLSEPQKLLREAAGIEVAARLIWCSGAL